MLPFVSFYNRIADPKFCILRSALNYNLYALAKKIKIWYNKPIYNVGRGFQSEFEKQNFQSSQ